MDFANFASLGAKVAYTAHLTRPDLLAHANLLSQITAPSMTEDDIGSLRTLIDRARVKRPLHFIFTDPERFEVAFFIDAAFGTNSDMSSQNGIIICLRDPSTSCLNVVHATSAKARRIARSALSAETLALSDGFNVGYAMNHALSSILGRIVPLVLYTDARSINHLTILLAPSPTEKRLAIDIAGVRKAFESRDIADIILISGGGNPADGCTKVNCNVVLERTLDSNYLEVDVQAWLEREKVVPALIPARDV
jgi:hypothetical protein